MEVQGKTNTTNVPSEVVLKPGAAVEDLAKTNLNFPVNDAERQEAADPFFPRSTKNDFLDEEAAVQFYRQQCKKNGLLVNNSFVKYLRSGSVIMEFDNGYLGENGIVPIMATLRRVRLMKLLLPKCALQDEEIILICDSFCDHPTIETIDLRGNKITATGAKHIMRMLMRNKRITEVLIDAETPKSAAIFRQAAENGAAELRTFSCLVCHHPVVYTLSRQVEMTLLKNLLMNFTTTIERVSAVQVEVLFRLILVACEAHNGILSLCSETCVERMSRFLYESLGVVMRACYVKVAYELPSNTLIRQCLPAIINDLQSRPLTKKDYCGEDSDDSEDIENFFDNAIDMGVHEECTICGQKGKCLRNGVVLMMKQLVKEVEKSEEISSSGLLRLCHLMISQVDSKPCSRKCIRQIIRFGVYGFYGVIRAYPKQEPLLTSTGVRLDELPEEGFSVVDFATEIVERLDEEEITCALTVASAMEDIDGVPIDPYMIFAIGRHLRHLPPNSIGMELQSACEAVHLVGCLAQADAPFKRREGDRPPRRLYANWEDWYLLGDVQKYLFSAFARRRSAVFCVDGPHGNAFDNIRAALWAFRRQRRSVVVAMKFAYSWLVAKCGVVSETSSAAGGFYTTLKVVGQTIINNSFFLIVQANLGTETGQKGFFYIPKSVFNRHISHNPYIFVDIPKNNDVQDVKKLYAAQLVTPFSVAVVEAAQQHGDLFSHVESAARLYPFASDRMKSYGQLLKKIPPAISFICDKAHPPSSVQSRWIKYTQMLGVYSPMSGQMAHYLNEICPPEVCRFFYEAFSSGSHFTFAETAYTRVMKLAAAAVSPSGKKAKKKGSVVESLEWVPVLPTTVDGVSVADVGRMVKKKTKKKASNASPEPRGKSRSLPTAAKIIDVTSSESKSSGTATYLRQIWESEEARLELLAQKPEEHHYVSENVFPYACSNALNRHLRSQQLEGSGTENEANVINCDWIGRRWNVLHVTDENGKLTNIGLFTIHQSACIFDFSTGKCLVPMKKMELIDLLVGFPFYSGFTSCFHHPKSPRNAFVFAGNLWIEWDSHKQKCLIGPFEIGSHPKFSKLPARFHASIDAAIPVPNTPYVFFITQKSYVLFNMDTNLPECSPQLLNPFDRENSHSKLNEDTPAAPALPVALPSELCQSTCSEVMTCFWNTDAAEKKNGANSISIVCVNGEVLNATFTEEEEGSKKSTKCSREPITKCILVGLPMAFKQMTSDAIPILCDAVAAKYFQPPYNKQLNDVECFKRPSAAQMDSQRSMDFANLGVIVSNMKKTEVAEKSPLSILSMDAVTESGLLCDEVQFLGNAPGLDDKNDFCPQPTIEYDLGVDMSVCFCAVVLVLDVSTVNGKTLDLAPITVMVESSEDQVTYETHCIFRALRFVSFGSWSGVHVARFWRLRFVDPVPQDVGVAKVFWYKAKFSSLVGRLPVLDSFTPAPNTAIVNVAAEMMLRPVSQLWGGAGGNPVFATGGRKEWFDKHAVLPLLPMGDTCLFFCGSAFAEYDMTTYEVIAGRSMDIQTHPAFSALPAPFCTGFDAIFYPDETDSTTVMIIRDGYEILWDLVSGCAAGQAGPCESNTFEGSNVDMTKVYDVMNVWGRPGEVDIIFLMDGCQAGILRWHVKKRFIIEPPKALHHDQRLYHKEFNGKPLLCAFSTPRHPKSAFVFCDNQVAHPDIIPTPTETRYTKQFFRLVWRHSNWSQSHTGCTVSVDFLADLPLVLGIEFVSSPSNGMSWEIEYSDDNMNWIKIGTHLQEKTRSRTTWLPRHVENRSHRFWRFSSASSLNSDSFEPVAYKLLSFLTLPTFKFQEPSRSELFISSSSKDDIQGLFRAGQSISFDAKNTVPSLCQDSVDDSALPVHHITLDYGNFPVHLMSMSCRCDDSGSDNWCVLYSDEGKTWYCAGTWRRFHQNARFSWFVGRSYRFWRFEVRVDKPRSFHNFSLNGYKGPFLALDCQLPMSNLSYPGLVPLLYESNCSGSDSSQDCVRFQLTPGSVLTVDTKADTAAVIGLVLRCAFSSAEKVDFVVEHSNDVVWWFEAVRFSLFGASLESSAYWNTVGSHRFWRIRVLSTSSEGYLLVKKILFSVSQSNLYRMFLSQKESRLESSNGDTEQPESIYFNSPVPVSIVKAEANLPPNSVYVVEKLGLDGISWDPVTLMENAEATDHKVIEKGWDTTLPSCSWRLRFLEFWDNNSDSLTFPTLILPVKWFVFTSRRLLRVGCEDVPDLEVTVKRFDILEAIESLHLNRSGFPVLQIAPPEVVPPDEKAEQEAMEEAARKAAAEEEKKQAEEAEKKKKQNRSNSKQSKVRSKSEPRTREEKKKKEEELQAAKKVEEEKEKAEKAAAARRALPPPEDPSVLFSFKHPTRLSQVYVQATLPELVSGSATPRSNQSKRSSSSAVEPIKRGVSAEPHGAASEEEDAVADGNNANATAEEEMSVAFGPNPPLTIVVELGDNGVDFVPVAKGVYAGDCTSLSWCGEDASRYWRVRFENTFDETELRVHCIKWYSYRGVASSVLPSDAFLLTNTVYNTQLQEIFNYEEEFCTNCRLGFNQAKSEASKLRDEGDLDKIGQIAKNIWQRKKAYQAFFSKIGKAAARNVEAPEGEFFGTSQTLSKDIHYFLHMTAMKFPDCGFGNLIELVGAALVLKDVQFNKKDAHWFYPSFEVSGPLQDEFFGFSAVPTSYSVLWSLSVPVQRDLTLLDDPSMSCVSVHLASPLITLSIESDSWNPEDHFPYVPFLYHGGYSNKNMTIVFALNEITFTEKYFLRAPVTGKPVASQTFRVFTGVNFIRVDSIGSCPAPVFNMLKHIYPDTFLDSFKTPIVLNTNALRCRGGKFHFTLPGKGVSFGIEGLTIDALEFEITMAMFNQSLPPPPTADETSLGLVPEMLYGECDYHVSFITHGARFQVKGNNGMESIPLALTGSFDKNGSAVIQLSGTCMTSSIPLDGIRETFLTSFKVSGVVSASSSKPQAFLVPRLVVSGNLVLPTGLVYACHYDLPNNNFINVPGKLYLDLCDVNFEDLTLISLWARSVSTDRAPIFPKDKSVRSSLFRVYASLEVDLENYQLHGRGVVKMGNQVSDDAEILVDTQGFNVVGSIPYVNLGNVELESPDETTGVVMEASSIFLEGSRPELSVLLSGRSNFFCPGASTKVHLSRRGCICLCNTANFDLCLEENSSELSCSNAQILLHDYTLLNKVVEHLKSAPMIVALLANGLPFCLSNESLTASPYNAIAKRVVLKFSGVFFGSFFEVASPSFDPSDMLLSYDALCELLALRAVEECQETIWASYGSVVGCLQLEDAHSKPHMENTFVSKWLPFENVENKR